MKLRRLLLAAVLAVSPIAALAQQSGVGPTPPAGASPPYAPLGGCVYMPNGVALTGYVGPMGLTCGVNGGLNVNVLTGGGGGGGGAASQTATNASDGQATNTANQQAVVFPYIFNGTTYDRLRGTGGALNAAITNTPTIANTGFNALQGGAANASGNPFFVTVTNPTSAAPSTVTANQGTAGANPWPTTDSNAAQTITAPGTGAAKAQGIQGISGGIAVPVSEADGANTTLGSKADAANAATGSSAMAIFRQLHADLIAPTPAGTAIIGKVGIDQTTNGTTNGVFIVNTPTIYPAGFVDTSRTTLAAGQFQNMRVDNQGQIRSSENGSSDPTAGITPVVTQAGTTISAKASAGNLYSIYAVNQTTTAGYLVCVNSASTITGAIAPLDVAYLNGAVGATAQVNYGAGPPNAYSTGIACGVTTNLATYTAGGNAFIAARWR